MRATPLVRDFALEVHFSKWEFSARYHMTASDVESMRLSELLALADPDEREAFESLWLGYTETFGAPDLREAIAETYTGLGADEIICFSGAEEGLYSAMRVIMAPDAHAVVVTPNYQAAETVPLSIGAVTGVPLEPERGWALDIERVAAAIRPNTRLVSINFPNNPTGKVLERDRFDALVELCRKRGLWLFSDEVYRGLERDPAIRLPQVAEVYERGLSLNVMSKAYGLPGLRIGWIACRDRQMLHRLERYKHYLSICNSAPSERLARIALMARTTILDAVRGRLARNRDRLDSFFAEHPDLFDWQPSDGGCVAFPRYLGQDGVEQFCERLVTEAGVLLLPASLYRSDIGPVPDDRFRIGFGRADMDDGLSAMTRWLDSRGRAA